MVAPPKSRDLLASVAERGFVLPGGSVPKTGFLMMWLICFSNPSNETIISVSIYLSINCILTSLCANYECEGHHVKN